MKEVTRVINAQITIINKMSDEEAEGFINAKEHAEKVLKDAFNLYLSADDVQVSVQDFVMDNGEANE